jgi:hypothetical protein
VNQRAAGLHAGGQGNGDYGEGDQHLNQRETSSGLSGYPQRG